MLSPQDIIRLLRLSVDVQVPSEPILDEEGNPVLDEEGNPTFTKEPDKNYLALTDDDLTLYIKLGVTRFLPEVQDLADLPDGSEFAVTLLAKIELYSSLAVKRAEKVDMGVDNNTYLKQSQKFDHYMKLIEDAKDQYKTWLDNEGAELTGIGVVNTYDVLLSNRHYTRRNYEKQAAPKVRVKVMNVTTDSVEFSWTVSNTSHFSRFKVYFSKDQIIDVFAEGSGYKAKIKPGAQCLVSTSDIRNTSHRVSGLMPDTDYHIAVVSIERNQVFGYSETLFTTLEEPPEEPDINEGEFTDPVTPPTEGGDVNG